MSQCPHCSNPLPDDFGLIECPGCGAAVFLDMDGSVRADDEAGDGQINRVGSAVVEEVPPSEEEEISFWEGESEELKDEPNEFDKSGHLADNFSEESDSVIKESPEGYWDESQEESEVHFAVPADATSAPGDLSEIAHFANSEASQGREGVLRYDLILKGIDSSDLRQSVREAIEDKKFLWDADNLIASIKKGELVIKNISSVKALLIVQRVSELPLHIEWRQYAIHN